MRLKDVFLKKKYQTRIYLWVTFLIVVSIITLSTVIYMNVENSVLNKEYQSNQLVLSQMKFNIDFMDEMIRNICTSTYYRSDVQTLMNDTGKTTYEEMNTINQISNTIVQSNPYILSVNVYNNRKKVFYSTFNSFIYDDAELDQLIRSYGKVPVLRPIVRKMMTYHVGDRSEYSNVITYFMYEMTDANNNMNGAVIVNIKLNWLVDNVKTIDTANQNNLNQVFILDDKGEFFDAGAVQTNENEQLRSTLKDAYLRNSSQNVSKDADFFKSAFAGKDYIVSYIKLRETNWSILIAQPYDMVIGYINKLKTSIFLITAIILVLILLAAYSISRGLYKPVEQLIRQVRTNVQKEPADGSFVDEFTYLNEAYKNSKDLLDRYSMEKTSNIMSIKLYFLRKLLIHSFSIPDEEFERNCRECGVCLDAAGPFLVVAAKLDNESALQSGFDPKTREALKSAFAGEVSGVLSGSFRNEPVEMEGNEVVFILNACGGDGDTRSLAALLREAQAGLAKNYDVSFTAAVSDRVAGVREITGAYNHAVDYLRYRFVFGPGSVILPDMLGKNLSSRQFDYSYKYEKQLAEELRRYDMEKVSASLSSIIDEVKKLDFNDIMFSLAHLVNIIRNSVYELNNSRKEPVNINALLSGLDAAQCETVSQFQARLLEVLRFIVGRYEDEQQPGNRDTLLAETVRAMIDSGYQDCNLNVSDLAAKARMSTSKVSKAFKENTGMSIPEYINEVRLQKAVEWIENSKLSIGEIMHRIGIENESYFYRIFKAKYGMTPREYAASKLFKPV